MNAIRADFVHDNSGAGVPVDWAKRKRFYKATNLR
jgi:hypothetical protein